MAARRLLLLLTGCASSESRVSSRQQPWALIESPHFGDVLSEPQYTALASLPRRGDVIVGDIILVDTNRLVVDLTARDGIREGNIVSVGRDGALLRHPVTGEVLGELDVEVAAAKILEVRERFSIAKVLWIVPGKALGVGDHVVPR